MRIIIDYPDNLHDTEALEYVWRISHESGGVQWQKSHEKYWETSNGYGIEKSQQRGDSCVISIKEVSGHGD